MSRCFPFPPQRYEKKIRANEADSLIKEKEKKHTKEKKGREKKEGKEIRDKETSKDKDQNGDGDADSKFILDLARRIIDEEAIESGSPQKISFPCEATENHISVSQANRRNFAVEKRSRNGFHRVSSCTELQEKKNRKKSVERSDKPLDSKGINKSEPKYTTHRSSLEEKTEVLNKTVQEKLKYVEGGTRLKEKDLDTTSFRVQELKRKDHETNGLLSENGSRPNKIQRPVISPLKPVFELQGTVYNPEVVEHRINGFVESQEPKSFPTISSSVKVKENGEESAKKRPHSDLKYLDKILSVPKREELHEIDDDDDDEQEWLFGQSSVRLVKKQITDSTTLLDETLQVWNKAIRIESADIIALPYVVPF